MTRPHDIADLYLAPLALAVDAELDRLKHMNHDDLLYYIALITNHVPRTVAERRDDLAAAVTHHLDLHGWRARVDPRGLRLTNGKHSLVIGLPPALASYLALDEQDAVSAV